MDIEKFKASINNLGVQKTNNFEINIIPPTLLSSGNVNRNGAHIKMDDLSLRINSVNWPGVQLGLEDTRPFGYGLPEARPNAVTYQDISMTIITDGYGKIYNFFRDWLELVYPTNDGKNCELFEYPNNYYGGLELYFKTNIGKTHTVVTFEKPFLTALGDVTYSWDNTNQIALIPVSFKYKKYKINPKYYGTTEINN